jgi:hypothetical protein
MKCPEQSQPAYRAVRAVIDRIKAIVRHAELNVGLKSSTQIRQVYDLSHD